MQLEIFALRDIKVDQFATPMFMQSKGAVIRSLADEVNKAADNNILNKHPEDFELYHIGSYNTDTGEITPQRPTQVITATELLAPRN